MSGTLPRIAVLDSRAREHNVPVNVLFELTHRCNERCFHCYVVPELDRELDTAEVNQILDELAHAGTLFVTFTGGEVMLRRDIFEILAHARDLHFAVRLFTNGTLIDESAADKIAEAHPVDVGVSIYGASASTHERVTGVPGSFDTSLRALRLLHERGIMTHLKCVLMAENIEERSEIASLAESLGAYVQFDPHLTARNDGDDSPLEHSMADSLLADVVHADRLRDEVATDAALCSAGRDAATISPTGKVLPCVQWPTVLGDLRSSTFEEIWGSAQAVAIRDITLSRLESCRSCGDLGFCSPCLGLNVIENGQATQPSSSVCRMARARREGAGE